MMKKSIIFIFIIVCIIFYPKDTNALTSEEYASRNVCSYEVAIANYDDTFTHVACYSDYNSARTKMEASGDHAFIFDATSYPTKIIDANAALVDLTVSGDLIIFNTEASLNGRDYTYTSPLYYMGGTDAALIDANGSYSARVMIAGMDGWIKKSSYEIVPLAWVKSHSYYTVNEHIRHNYTADITNTYSGSMGSTIGPKPEMINQGIYYSYDGHYFYTSHITMIKDYQQGHRNNSVNNNDPYYNYYQYLSNHTKTTYSSVNIDEYIRNNLGAQLSLYGDKSFNGSSKLHGQGTYFYYSQQKHGVNAILSLSLSRNETGNGTSSLAITKNNGFGLNAVDSNPTQSSNWYPTFSSSILGYAKDWVTNKYANPTAWQYFGPAFGDKYIGMNVKYASDPYWSEKMAANYYSFDLAKGLQDYNYYQLGKTNGVVNAHYQASKSSKVMYTYPEKDDNVVIVDEITNSEGTWYVLQSDVSIDQYGNGSTTTDYNWDSKVYVKKEEITLINEAKDGYKEPNSVTEYQDNDYSYDLYVENSTLNPKVATITNETSYYYDSTLTQPTGKKVLKDKVVMVYSEAFDEHGNTVAYLVTSDYKYDQKEWIPAGNLIFTSSYYAQQKIGSGAFGEWSWVNSTPYDVSHTVISGIYSYAYVPVLDTIDSDGFHWYKVPVSLDTNTDSYGWTIKECLNVYLTPYYYDATEDNAKLNLNEKPTIEASNKEITQKQEFNYLEGVTANDKEDGNITSKITYETNLDINTPGIYTVTYKVTDSKGETTTKTINVEVLKDQIPVITANDINLTINQEFNPLDNVTAYDNEDKDITKDIKVIENTVNTTTPDTYKITYQVTDSFKNTVEKTIKVTVAEKVLIETESNFYFDYLKEVDNNLEIKGYQTITGINHTLTTDINYEIIFVNVDTNEEIKDEMIRITNQEEMTRPVLSLDGKDYTYSWFKYSFDLSILEQGNYHMYITATSTDNYSKNLVTNKLYKEQISNYNSDGKNIIIRNDYNKKEAPIELIIREETLAEKTASYYYNQYDTYRTFEFTEDNKLHLMGLSYSYGMDLSENTEVERTIIFENKENYQTYSYDLSSTTEGLYQAMLPENDGFDKTRAWYDKELDISNIPKGEYIIYITTESNITDIYELTEKLNRSLSSVKATIDSKDYSFNINFDYGNRIELIVK